jgi:hypothetical protein
VELVYVLAATVAVAAAVWLQLRTSMARGYAWLSRAGALVFAALFIPTIVSHFTVATVAQAVVLASLPLIGVPYQVRMMKFIEGAKAPRAATGTPGSGSPRGPGGGRVRPRAGRRR